MTEGRPTGGGQVKTSKLQQNAKIRCNYQNLRMEKLVRRILKGFC